MKQLFQILMVFLFFGGMPLAFAYATTEVFYASTTGATDCLLQRSGTNWSGIQSETTASSVDCNVYLDPSGDKLPFGGLYNIQRVYLPFDTSSLPDDAVITSADLYLVRNVDGNYEDADLSSQYVVSMYCDDPTACDVNDYEHFGIDPLATPVSLDDIFTAGNVTFSVATTTVSLSSYSQYGLRNSRDVENSEPTGFNIISFNDAASGYVPSLTVTYTVPEPPPTPTSTPLTVPPTTLDYIFVNSIIIFLLSPIWWKILFSPFNKGKIQI